MAVQKPTKQQIAYAKARAGGNTTSKTTPARMAKGAKDIALFAAGIVGPGKVVKAAGKAAKVVKAESKAANAAQKIKSASGKQSPLKVSGPPPGVSSNIQVQRKGNIKLVNPTNSMSRATRNISEDVKVQNIKSGAFAKAVGKKQENWNKMNPGGKKSTVKINSNPYKGK